MIKPVASDFKEYEDYEEALEKYYYELKKKIDWHKKAEFSYEDLPSCDSSYNLFSEVEELDSENKNLLEYIEFLHEKNNKLTKQFNDCKNELCFCCGKYKDEHLGACEGCKWYKEK